MRGEKYQNQRISPLDPNHFQLFLLWSKFLTQIFSFQFGDALLYFWGARTFRQRKLPGTLTGADLGLANLVNLVIS